MTRPGSYNYFYEEERCALPHQQNQQQQNILNELPIYWYLVFTGAS